MKLMSCLKKDFNINSFQTALDLMQVLQQSAAAQNDNFAFVCKNKKAEESFDVLKLTQFLYRNPL